MKKYLLLASVAGCLMAGNAMAGTIADDYQSATIDIYATIVPVEGITAVQDMKFGTIYVPSNIGANEKIATLSDAGVITLHKGLKSEGTTQAGGFTIAGEVEYSVVCGSGDNITTDDPAAGCSLTGLSGQELSVHINVPTELDTNGEARLGGELYFISGGSSGVNMETSGSITVTINH